MPTVSALEIDVHYDEFGPADAARTFVGLHGMGVDNRCAIADAVRRFRAEVAGSPVDEAALARIAALLDDWLDRIDQVAPAVR